MHPLSPLDQGQSVVLNLRLPVGGNAAHVVVHGRQHRRWLLVGNEEPPISGFPFGLPSDQPKIINLFFFLFLILPPKQHLTRQTLRFQQAPWANAGFWLKLKARPSAMYHRYFVPGFRQSTPGPCPSDIQNTRKPMGFRAPSGHSQNLWPNCFNHTKWSGGSWAKRNRAPTVGIDLVRFCLTNCSCGKFSWTPWFVGVLQS